MFRSETLNCVRAVFVKNGLFGRPNLSVWSGFQLLLCIISACIEYSFTSSSSLCSGLPLLICAAWLHFLLRDFSFRHFSCLPSLSSGFEQPFIICVTKSFLTPCVAFCTRTTYELSECRPISSPISSQRAHLNCMEMMNWITCRLRCQYPTYSESLLLYFSFS